MEHDNKKTEIGVNLGYFCIGYLARHVHAFTQAHTESHFNGTRSFQSDFTLKV